MVNFIASCLQNPSINKRADIDFIIDCPKGKMLVDVKYQENPIIKKSDAIIELANSEQDNILAAVIITKTSDSYGILPFHTRVPIYRIPAYAFLYLLGQSETNNLLKQDQIKKS